ncbi:50S ribosomal protein L31e [Candidatus Hecatella orcuttiae]|jgi:large subunit ribosomal protein L31e|uniref:50S ribosomal protein L31e n=1 Tax=Candidatus Hecatella orcuttiae TaxID=1935119 RepID=UPI0028682AD1|nr:50S ribosomal protein L31e [Candidatus Hecatella orcuttiae]
MAEDSSKPSEDEAEEREEEEEEAGEEVEEERLYVVPFGRVWNAPRPYRTPKAVKALKDFIKKHMKVDRVRVDGKLNQFIWGRSIEKPPRKIRVRVTKDRKGVATAYLAEAAQ